MRTTAMLALGILGLLTPPATAADQADLERFRAADRVFHAALESSDPSYLAQAILELAAATKALCDPATSKEVIAEIRPCLRHRPIEVKLATIHAYGRLAVPRSSRDLRRYADKKRNRRQPHEIKLAAIGACGCIADSGTHGVLLAYMRVPSRHKERLELALAATRGLAHYKNVKGYRRFTALHEYMHAFTLIHGAAHCRTLRSAAATRWHMFLLEDLLKTFCALTGKYAQSWQECDLWWRANKRRVKAGRKSR